MGDRKDAVPARRSSRIIPRRKNVNTADDLQQKAKNREMDWERSLQEGRGTLLYSNDIVVSDGKKIKLEEESEHGIKQEVSKEDNAYHPCQSFDVDDPTNADISVKYEDIQVVVNEDVEIPFEIGEPVMEPEAYEQRDQSQDEDENSSVPNTSSGNQCEFCEKQICSKFLRKHHQFCKHPEKYLAKFRRPNISHSRFNLCCKLLLSKESNSSVIYDEKSKSTCPYCSKQIRNVAHVKLHIMENHFDLFGEKLLEVQGNDLEMKILLKETRPNAIAELVAHFGQSGEQVDGENNISWRNCLLRLCESADCGKGYHRFGCPLCSELGRTITFHGVEQLEFHMFNRHTEEFFATVKKPEVEVEAFKSICNKLFEDIIQPMMVILETKVNADDSDLSVGCPFNCSGQTFYINDDGFIRVHLIKVHMDVLIDKLKHSKSGNVTIAQIFC